MNRLTRSKLITKDINETLEYHSVGIYVAISLTVTITGTEKSKERHYYFMTSDSFSEALSQINKCKSDLVYKTILQPHDISDCVHITTAQQRKKVDSMTDDEIVSMLMLMSRKDTTGQIKHSKNVYDNAIKHGGQNIIIIKDGRVVD